MSRSHVRTKILMVILYTLFFCIIGRLAFWQILHRSSLQAAAEEQYTRTVEVTAHRGRIFTSEGYPLVTNQQVYRLFAQPNQITQTPVAISAELAPLLLDPVAISTSSAQLNPLTALENFKNDLLKKLSDPHTKWVALKSKIDDAAKQKIDDLHIVGLGFDKYEVRAYPEASMAAQVTGFVGKDKDGNDQGYFGVEGEMDRELRGSNQQKTFQKDGLGFHSLFDAQNPADQTDGRDVVLSIRRDIQHMVEDMLAQGIQKYGASAGEIDIMDPKTGKMLAMAAFPSYAQDQFQQYDPSFYKNPSVSDTYEPGSIFKVLTVATGVDSGVVSPLTTCPDCAHARVIGQYTIRTWNDEYHPDITMQDALAKSDNVAMIFISDLLSGTRFVEYIKRFKIGEPTHIELQEDTATPLRKDWHVIDYATASFGQGIAVNSLQMVRAVGAIANKGVMMRPSVIQAVIDPATKTTVPVAPVAEGQVVSPVTADTVTKMMVYAADNGESKWAVSKTHLAATKTGTAQIPLGGHYDDKKTVASFIGFAPPSDPKFVMLVKLTNPTSSPWAAETSAPLWYQIADKLYLLMNVPPDR